MPMSAMGGERMFCSGGSKSFVADRYLLCLGPCGHALDGLPWPGSTSAQNEAAVVVLKQDAVTGWTRAVHIEDYPTTPVFLLEFSPP